MKAEEKARLYRELAKLVGADFHLDRAVSLLLGQSPAPPTAQFLQNLQAGLAAGKSASEAVSTAPPSLCGDVERALISAGEHSGQLGQAFRHLEKYFATVHSGISQARGALIYPLVLLHVGILLPELPKIIVETGQPGNPWLDIGVTVAVVWSLVGVGWWLWKTLNSRAMTSEAVDRFLRALPVIGGVRRHWSLARFCQVFHAGLLAAVRIAETVRLAGLASQSGVIREGAASAAARVDEGQPVSVAMASTGGRFPMAFVNSVATAEEAGTLDREMERWAALEMEEATQATQHAAEWLPRVAYGVIVIYVVWRIISMFLTQYLGPYKALMEEIG